MTACLIVEDLMKDVALMQLIKSSIDVVLQVQNNWGNFHHVLNDDPNNGDKVHWCHGAPGAIPMLITAAKMFPEL